MAERQRKQSAPNIGTPPSPSDPADTAVLRRKYSEASPLARSPATSPTGSVSDSSYRGQSVSSTTDTAGAKSPKPRSRLSRIFSFLKPGRNKSPRSETPALADVDFEAVCPVLPAAIPVPQRKPQLTEPAHTSASLDRMRDVLRSERSERQHSVSSAPPAAKKGWTPPDSWATMKKGTYVSDEAAHASGGVGAGFELVSPEQPVFWALRIFKPVEAADVGLPRTGVAGNFVSITINVVEAATAADVCMLLVRKFRSAHDLTKFRLYFVTQRTERLVEHSEQPVRLVHESYARIGYRDEDRMWTLSRDDQSYYFRFVFRPYPLPPPGPEDFLHTEPGRSAPRITDKAAYLDSAHLSVVPTALFRMSRTIEFLDLSRNTMLDLPTDLFERLAALRAVRLVGNLLRTVPRALLAAPSITHLDMSSNFLTGGELAVLDALPALTHLNVSCNRIDRLPPSLGGGPASYRLRALDISSNYLAELPPCLWALAELRDLNASFNRITHVPPEMAALGALRSLILVGNGIVRVDPGVVALPGLCHLDLRGNLLSVLQMAPRSEPVLAAPSRSENSSPEAADGGDVFAFDAFPSELPGSADTVVENGVVFTRPVLIPDTELDGEQSPDNDLGGERSSDNELGVREFSVGAGESLGGAGESIFGAGESSVGAGSGEAALLELYVDHNELVEMPEAPCWPSITTLSAMHNGLVSVTLGNRLTQLRALSLASSRLVRLPDDFFDSLPMLETLDLQNNSLTRLPPSLNALRALTHLSVHSNALSELAIDGAAMQSLTHVVAHTNNIVHVAPAIWACPALRVLNVSSNFLAALPDAPEDAGDEPPLAAVLEELLAADNRLRDEGISALFDVQLRALRVLNLSYNRIVSLGDALAGVAGTLKELYLSGNTLTALPAGIELCAALRMLFVNGNRVTNLPGELAAAATLAVFDAQSNALKYNVANWPYDWNWNYSPNLEYLSLAHNRRLDVRASPGGAVPTDFKSMTRLRALDLTDVPVSAQCLPQTATDLQIRVGGAHNLGVGVSFSRSSLTGSPVSLSGPFNPPGSLHGAGPSSGPLSPGAPGPSGPPGPLNAPVSPRGGACAGPLPRLAFAEYCGRGVVFDQTEVVRRHFMGLEKDHIVGLFDGKGTDIVSAFLSDVLPEQLQIQLRMLRDGEDCPTALRRAFIATNRELSAHPVELAHRGSTACVLYVMDEQMYVANVGDTQAVMSRGGIAAVLTTRHHAWARGEQARIRALGGYISLQGLVERELPLTRMFGHHQLLPFVNAEPAVRELALEPTDEFVLLATDAFWTVMSPQMAVDVARKERGDPNVAVQKLRDMAIARGVTTTMKVLFVDLRGIASADNDAEPAAVEASALVERRRNAFRKRQQEFQDQVLSRLDDEIPPPKPPCSFVFTDIKSSSRSWFQRYNAMRIAHRQHCELVRRLLRIHGGYEMKTEGDAFVLAFQTPLAALRFCVATQLQFLENEHWPREILDTRDAMPVLGADGRLLYRGLSLRMGIHHGYADDEMDVVARRMDYLGVSLIIAQRVMDRADGGQVNITDVVRQAVMEAPAAERPDVVFYDLGFLELKGVDHPVRVHAVYPRVLAERYVVRTGGDTVTHADEAQAGGVFVARPDAAERAQRRADSLSPNLPAMASRLSIAVIPEDGTSEEDE